MVIIIGHEKTFERDVKKRLIIKNLAEDTDV